MSEHLINQLGKLFKRLISILEDFRIEVTQSLSYVKKLPDHFKELRQTINESSFKQIQAQGEMEVHVRMAEIKAQQQYVIGEEEVIKEFKEQLERDIQRVNDRYKKIDQRITDECAKRIRQLDSHLLDLPKSFPKTLLHAVTDKISPLINGIMLEANISYKERVGYIHRVAKATESSIQNFIESRQAILQTIDEYQQEESPLQDETYHIPAWLIEVTDPGNGKTQKKLFFPGSFSPEQRSQSNDQGRYGYKCADPLQELHELFDHEGTKQKIFESVDWQNDTGFKTYFGREISKVLGRYGENDNPIKKAYLNSLSNDSLKTNL